MNLVADAVVAAVVDTMTRARADDRAWTAVTVVSGAAGILARAKVDDLADAVAAVVVAAAAAAGKVIHAKVDGRGGAAAAAGKACLCLVLADLFAGW